MLRYVTYVRGGGGCHGVAEDAAFRRFVSALDVSEDRNFVICRTGTRPARPGR